MNIKKAWRFIFLEGDRRGKICEERRKLEFKREERARQESDDCILAQRWNHFLKNNFSRGGMGYWAVYYTSP